MQKQPDASVIKWLDLQPAETVWISSITLFEAAYGVNILVDGQRKALLQQRFQDIIKEDLANRILLLDVRAANMAAHLAAKRKACGRPVDIRDTFIAGIAMAHAATLATRNTRHFDDLPTPVINPWAVNGRVEGFHETSGGVGNSNQ